VIAHRGASAHAPENTLAAFQAALDLGAREVEMDVRFSADECIVVFHDDALDRKTDARGRVRHHSAASLRRVDIGSWFDRTHPHASSRFAGTPIALLDEVLELLAGRVHHHIEIKGFDDWLPLRLLQAIDAHDLRGRVTVSSFSLRPLLQMRRIAPAVPICFLLRDAHDALRSAEFRPELEGRSPEAVHDYWIDVAAESGLDQVGVRAADTTPRAIARAADRGLEVRGWGVRDEDDLRHLVRLGAVGATVDWPGRALEIVHELGADLP
jgi:glycerophosphoryl diester phosphodiesterase